MGLTDYLEVGKCCWPHMAACFQIIFEATAAFPPLTKNYFFMGTKEMWPYVASNNFPPQGNQSPLINFHTFLNARAGWSMGRWLMEEPLHLAFTISW